MTRHPSMLGRRPADEPNAEAVAPPVAPLPDRAPAVAPADDAPVAGADVLQLGCALLAPMARPTTLRCTTRDGRQFVVTTCRTQYGRARAEGLPVFVGGELVAMALAAAVDRAWPDQLAEWLTRKDAEPGWKLTTVDALGAPVSFELLHHAQQWTIGRVFDRLGVSLRAVEISEG